MVSDFSKRFPDLAQVRIFDLSRFDDVDDVIAELNGALKASGEYWQVSRANLPWVLGQSAPIIVIDGKIASAGDVPTADELAKALEQGLSYIPMGW